MPAPYIRDLISKSEIDGIADIMTRGGEHGMKTFDQAILELYNAGKITREEALSNANSRHNLEVKIRLASGGLQSPSDLLSIDES
ncbi:hypothetical protein [Marinobacter sp.]|uniref:hypothetical protein n=1 Tax=Marinobacter sp. TaxID=50741 RepID=UPI00257CD423|nr:hypothetical protein [Marinobacter sp.]